jgi:Zn-dependent peptidase ImmA (M78 family)
VSRPDDSFLTPEQLANVRRHADRLLRDAGALERFPTPIDDILAAAKVTIVDDEVLNESFMRRLAAKAAAGFATMKSALSKVLGLFEANDRLVIIDKGVPRPRIPFVKLHETGHGSMPHQTKLYALMQDCEQTLDPEITDLFEREANVFASETMFQGSVFAEQAHDREFGVKAALALAKQFGGSNYATFRRYVTTNPRACCLIVLEPASLDGAGEFRADVRRVVAATSFEKIYDSAALALPVTRQHTLASLVPRGRQRIVAPREIELVDRNGDRRECIGEAFHTGHQTLILLRDNRPMNTATVIMPGTQEFRATLGKMGKGF